VLPSVEHRRHKELDNRAEHAHQPTRERERRMRRFKSPGHAQRFLAAYGPIVGHCRPRRHRLTAAAYRATSAARFATWRAVAGLPAAACAPATPRAHTPPRRWSAARVDSTRTAVREVFRHRARRQFRSSRHRPPRRRHLLVP